jgi:hypothetical protein
MSGGARNSIGFDDGGLLSGDKSQICHTKLDCDSSGIDQTSFGANA